MKFRYFVILLMLAVSLMSPLALCAENDTDKDTIQSYLDALEANPNDKELLKTIVFYYMNIGDRQKVAEYATRLISLGEATGDRDFCRLYGLIAMSTTHSDDNSDKGFRQLEEARLIAENTGNRDALLSIHNCLGMYYMFVHNDLYTATSYYYLALEDAKSINDRRRYGIVLSNLAGAYLMMDDTSGQKLAEQSHEMALRSGEPVPLYYSKQILSYFYILSDSLDRVDALIGEVEDLHRKGGFGGEPDMYLVKAMLADRRGDFPAAYRNYAKALKNIDRSDASEISAIYLANARTLRRDRKPLSAINILEKGLRNLDTLGVKLYPPKLIKELVFAYRDAGDYKKALDYSLSYQAHQDSAFRISRERALQENRIRHEVYASERLIDEQRTELQTTRRRLLLLAVVVMAILLVLAVTYINYRKKNRLYRAIVSQNREYLLRERMLLEQIEKTARPDSAVGEQTDEPVSGQKPASALSHDKADEIMRRFTLLMTEQKLFKDPSLTVGSVAELLGSNRTYVSRAINELTGKTFTQIVNEYRIREAINLISDLDANIPLKQICADVGFNSISTFYTTFQSVTGMPPARYRTQLREI